MFAPLALDALTARIAGQAGFEAVYVSGGALGYAHAVFVEQGTTGTDRAQVLKTYRTLAELAGLGHLYDIEDATTERVEPSQPRHRRWLSHFALRGKRMPGSGKV